MSRVAGALRAINPVWLFFGPIFDKEMRTVGRQGSVYVVRAMYAIMMLAFLSMAALPMLMENSWDGSAALLQRQSAIAVMLSMVVGWVQFGLLTLLAPALTAPSICEERTKQTLASLATTPLASAQIVFGKLASRMSQVVILVLVSAPILLIIRVFGGVELEIVFAMTALGLSSALFSGSLGILCALRRKKAMGAIVFAVLITVLFYLWPMLLMMLIAVRGPSPAFMMGMLDYIGWVNPPIAMFLATMGLANPAISSVMSAGHWLGCSAVMVVLSMGICAYASVRFRRLMLAEIGGGTAVGRKGGEKRAAKRAKKAARRGGGSRCVGNRPVLWREMNQPLMESRRSMWIVYGLMAAVVGLFLYNVDYNDEGYVYPLHVMGTIFVVFLSAISSTGSISGEREARTIDVLLTTDVSPVRIVYAKAFGGVWRMKRVMLFIAGHALALSLLGVLSPFAVLQIFLLQVGAATFLAGTGVWCSLVVKRSSLAAMMNIGIGLAVWLGIPMSFAILAEVLMWGSGDLFDRVGLGVLCMNPVAMTVMVVELGHQTSSFSSFGNNGMVDLFGFGFEVEQVGLTIITFVALGVMSGVGILVAGYTGLRMRGRLSRAR